MFDQHELNQFRGVVREVIVDEVPPLVRKIVLEIVHGELLSFYEHQLMPQFDDIHRELARMSNVNVTKDYQEERLERFRSDLGLKYRQAN